MSPSILLQNQYSIQQVFSILIVLSWWYINMCVFLDITFKVQVYCDIERQDIYTKVYYNTNFEKNMNLDIYTIN